MNQFALVLFVLATVSTARAENWPQFRGPKADGNYAGELPTEWGVNKNVSW